MVTPFKLNDIGSLEKVELIADADGRLHFFWNNRKDEFFHSVINADSISSSVSWTSPTKLSILAPVFDVTVDTLGKMHLIYIDGADNLTTGAGVYYRKLEPLSRIWTNPVALIASPYYRSVEV